jgi:hypothetical protein
MNKTALAIIAALSASIARADADDRNAWQIQSISDLRAVLEDMNSHPRSRQWDQKLRAWLDAHDCVTLAAEILSVLPNGALINCSPDFSASDPALILGDSLYQIPKLASPRQSFGTFMLRSALASRLADGDKICIIAIAAHEMYHYESAGGSAKTVRIYDQLVIP